MPRIIVGNEYKPEFPREWMARLREISPVSVLHTYLVPVWYGPGQRWVLYAALDRALIKNDEWQGMPISGYELRQLMDGPAPSEIQKSARAPYVSDQQWALWRKYNAFCRPVWVLQGEQGGHPKSFTAHQKWLLSVQHLAMDPPPVGKIEHKKRVEKWQREGSDPAEKPPYLQPCPFDERVVHRLLMQDRLYQLGGDLEKLKQSASVTARQHEMEGLQKEIRRAELDAVAQFMTPLVEMASQCHHHRNAQNQLVYMDGEGLKAKERLDYWLETGQYVMDPQATT